MRVLVCGSRNWTDRRRIYDRLSKLPKGTTIIEGACRGADLLALDVAHELKFHVIHMPADWAKHGRAAGPIRNRQMLAHEPELVIAFHENFEASKGTWGTVTEAKRRKIPVEIITGKVG